MSGMFKKLVLLARHDAIDRAAFSAHWAGPHAAIILSIIRHFVRPETVRYTQNHVLDTVFEHPSALGKPFAIDGIVELHVPAPRPSTSAVASGAVGRMIEDEKRFLRGLTECVMNQIGPDDDREGLKVIVVGGEGADLDGVCEDIETLRPLQLCRNIVTDIVGRDGLSSEPSRPAWMIEFWVAEQGSLATLRERLADRARKSPAAALSALRVATHVVLPDRSIDWT